MSTPQWPNHLQEGWDIPLKAYVDHAADVAQDIAQTAETIAQTAQARAADAEEIATDAQEAAIAAGGPGYVDPSKDEIMFVTELAPGYSSNIYQAFAYDIATGCWFVTQAVDNGSGEDTYVNKYSPTGVLLGTMKCTLAGHGTSIALEHRPDGLYFWIPWYTMSGSTITSHDLCRVKWVDPSVVGGLTTKVKTDTGVQVMNVFKPTATTYMLCAIDEYHDRVVIRHPDGYECRRLSDINAGVNAPVYPKVLDWQQGEYTISGDNFYCYNHSQDATLWEIKHYRWGEGLLSTTSIVPRDVGREWLQPDQTVGAPKNGWQESYAELEGMASWHDSYGRAHIMFGVATGGAGRRRLKVYGMAEQGHNELLAQTVDRLNAISPVLPDGRSRPLGSTTRFSDLNRPGWYYITSAENDTTTDAPAGAPRGFAYWLHVSGYDRTTGGVLQVLYLNRGDTAGVSAFWVRRVGADKAPTLWSRYNGTVDTGFHT